MSDLVNISSIAGRRANRGSAVYNLTKHGVGAFSEALRQEFATRHLRVSLVEPGAVITELVEQMGPEGVEAARKRFEGVERLEADDIADAIEYIVTRPWRVAVNEIMIRPDRAGMVIAVTGATGFVGRRTAERLDAPRLVVRDPSRAQGDVRQASSYGAHDEMRAALEGAHTLFLVPAEESVDRVEQHRTAVDAAVAAGVERIVYLSFLNAAPDSTFTLARDHWATEEHIRAAGPRVHLPAHEPVPGLRPADGLADGVIAGPAGDGRVAAVARDDVAAVARRGADLGRPRRPDLRRHRRRGADA